MIRRCLLILAPFALVAAACGGGLSAGNKTNTTVANADATRGAAAQATATQQAVDGPVPTAPEIAGVINSGFDGLMINYTAVSITTFRRKNELLAMLDNCAANKGGGNAPSDENYWPTVLGDCYIVGDALNWLYGYTHKQEFLYANLMMKRYHRAKFESAVEGGAPLDEAYWKLVADKIYSITPNRPVVAQTPDTIGG